MNIDVVVGAQFGSEAKGHVTQRLVDRAITNHEHVVNIRVAGPNAGHTAHTPDGTKQAFRQLPVGALRPGVACMIAPGSEVSAPVLLEEIDRAIRFADFDPTKLWVDINATLLEEHHVQAEAGMHEATGSTGKGIGAARADRAMRHARRVGDDGVLIAALRDLGVNATDTVDELLYSTSLDRIIIEGTQGYGLGLHTVYYPFVTSSDCRAIDFLAMAGVSPWYWADEGGRFTVWAVARVYPIRVAGNSGPLFGETTWEALGLPEEYTTVTQKVRRVGQWDDVLAWLAVEANGGPSQVKLAVTMLDQMFPDVAGIEDAAKLAEFEEVSAWLSRASTSSGGATVGMVTTGPNTGVWR